MRRFELASRPSALVIAFACIGCGGGKSADAEKDAPPGVEAAPVAPTGAEVPGGAPAAATGASAEAKAGAPSGAAAAAGQGDAGEGGEAKTSALEAVAALEPLGVEFCDGYLEAYRKCITFTVPEGDKEAHAETLLHEWENWTRTKAGAPEVAATALEVGCKSAQAAAAQKTRSLNCAW